MKHFKFSLFVIVLLISNFAFAQKSKTADLQDIRVDVVYLSSDLLEGRETGSEGEKLAAQYIASRFEKMGLKPGGSNNTWYQSFDFKYNPNPHGGTGGEDRTGKNVLGYLDNGAATTVVIGAIWGMVILARWQRMTNLFIMVQMTMQAVWQPCCTLLNI